MTGPISIFICHKKILVRVKDGHDVEQENARASFLHAILQTYPDRYNPWIDESQIGAGMAWETEIYTQLLKSDVLLVAIGPGTSKSEWVRREIALARALGIAIVPLGYDLSSEQFGAELKGLQIDDLQGKLTQNIKFPTKDALLQEIDSDLQAATERTAIAQMSVLSTLNSRRTVTPSKAPDKQKAFSKTATLGGSTIRLHVASGDLTKTSGIDVLVNSENDYMQMARFFETLTVSSLLRRRGARIAGGRYIDTVQQELDAQLGDRARPVQAGEVFATSAGGPDSKLATENRARYIFHVAAVQAIDAEARVAPFKQPYQIEDCTRSCFVKLLGLNRAQGIISPLGSPQRDLQERTAKDGNGLSKSILFPIFGTGQGGGSAQDAIGPMLAGMNGFFEDPASASLGDQLDDIYFAAFTMSDVAVITKAIQEFLV